MTFFNKKEEVIEVELTSYGKYLLSIGKWKPSYYTFFDDDVIYDSRYANIIETNSESVDRIKQSLRTKTQYNFAGVEEKVKKNLELIKTNKEKIGSLKLKPSAEKHYSAFQPLGDSFLGEKKSPSFKLNLLNGQISSSYAFQTSNNSNEKPNLKFPLINLKDTIYKRTVEKYDSNTSFANASSMTKVFEDGKLIVVNEDFILLDLVEKNVENKNKNFEIEIYMIEKDEKTGEEKDVQLHFDYKKDNLINGIWNDKIEVEEDLSAREADDLRATNYFTILVDSQIDNKLLCSLISNNPDLADNIYDSGIICEDNTTLTLEDLMNSRRDKLLQNLYNSSYDEEDENKC